MVATPTSNDQDTANVNADRAAMGPADTEGADAAPVQEHVTDDPEVVTTSRPTTSSPGVVGEGQVRSISSLRAERQAELRQRYGGFYWGSDFIGFAVATFFTIVFLGLIAAIAGGVGYQVGAPLPKVGHAVSTTTQTIGAGAAVASLIALFIAYVLGGYTAGRMARYDGAKNGFGVVLWTIVVTVILGLIGTALGNKFNVASQLHLKLNSSTFTAAGLIALAIALVVMVIGALLGGMSGERYHRAIDRDAGVVL
jgi:hypothetical protein